MLYTLIKQNDNNKKNVLIAIMPVEKKIVQRYILYILIIL